MTIAECLDNSNFTMQNNYEHPQQVCNTYLNFPGRCTIFWLFRIVCDSIAASYTNNKLSAIDHETNISPHRRGEASGEREKVHVSPRFVQFPQCVYTVSHTIKPCISHTHTTIQSKFELDPRILIHILIQPIQHIRTLHGSMHRNARPLPILPLGKLHLVVRHAAAPRHHAHDLRSEALLLIVLPDDFHFEYRGILDERLEDAFFFARDLVGVEGVSVLVVFGIVDVVEGFADADERFRLGVPFLGGGLDDGGRGVIGGG
mmetsp:Transcript_6276/g.13571  ORF Transcript_6276/g.13571 Transcript_6276/m.13571 type:complete len:260 (-) Transcript_6276:518-1297(-)